MYIELHSASAFSFLDGASLPEALVDRAAALGYPALALLDRDGFYGAPRFHLAAKKAGLRAIVGAEISVRGQVPGTGGQVRERGAENAENSQNLHSPSNASNLSNLSNLSNPQNPVPGTWPLVPGTCLWRLPLLVESQAGYKNLCRLITQMKLRSPKGEGALNLEELEGRTAGLVALIGREALQGPRHGVGGLVDRAIGIFGRRQVYIELQRHLRRDEESDNHALLSLASAFHVPVIATNGVRFAEPADRPLYDVLTCLRHKTTIAQAGRRLSVNAERYLKSPEEMSRLFSDLPHALDATRELADRLQYTMADLGYRFPEYPVPDGETMASFLRKMTDVGARERYRPYHARARAQIERELALIEKLDLAGYFLIVWDIVNYCRQHGILVQGRGSAANSAVCYSLGITAVDPVGMDLLFERFLSEERGEWPDIDLDLPSGDRREQAIQYVYERYGTLGAAPGGQGAAMTANVITYRGRSAARDVGKVLGLTPEAVDRMAKVMNPFEWIDPKDTLERHLREAGLDPTDPTLRTFGHLWERIHDLPRHLGQHSGGMIVCQGRLDEVVPLENATMPGRVVAQWDKDDCADMGIVKVDLLGLGMMAVLQDALTLVNTEAEVRGQRSEGRAECSGLSAEARAESRGQTSEGTAAGTPTPSADRTSALTSDLCPLTSDRAPLDLAHLPPDDPAVYRMLQEADTIGVFQVESRAQMATLPRMKPERFYDIVVEVAIIRPGPIVGQMVHPYLKRRRGDEPVVYPHPSLAPILERTLGVPLFQEQLLRMAMVAAGFTGGEAEELRRAFGFKRSEKRMRGIEQKLRDGIAQQGIGDDVAEEIIRAITSFALYGFPESHAASFALLVYASAYLKAHYPAAFYTAMLNNQPMGFYSPATLVKDAQRRGVRFAPIDVQVSRWDCVIAKDGAVRLGLRYVNGLRAEVGRAIEAAETRKAHSREEGRGGDADAVAVAGMLAAPAGACGRCPKCGCEDDSMIERVGTTCFCNVCAHEWGSASLGVPASPVAPRLDREASARFSSIDDFVARSGVHRDELRTLADIGALNAFGYDRRAAMWQIERALRPAGELYAETCQVPGPGSEIRGPGTPPLRPMQIEERIAADYDGTGLTIGPHPMALRREELTLRGVLRAADLPQGRHGRRVRVAGAVITRQRPGTAKGFVFLTLEDETGIANIIVRPDLFAEERRAVVGEAYLLVEGTLQIQEGVTSIKAERFFGLGGGGPAVEARDFH